jgi:hypothetical protein
MLSQHERRALADIEEHLSASEPELARLLQRLDPSVPPQCRVRRRVLGLALAALAAGSYLLAIAYAVHSPSLILLATAVLLPDSVVLVSLAVLAVCVPPPGAPPPGAARRCRR